MLDLFHNPMSHLGTASARSILLGKWLRAFCLGQAVYVLVITVNIVGRYARLITRTHTRVLPWHVILIGLSYFMAVAYTCISLVENFEHGLYAKTWFAFGGFAFGNIGLWLMILHLRYERNTENMFFLENSPCPACGSKLNAKFCARCGTVQPGHEKDAE
jgi:ribosomal protein S27AE